MFQTDALGRATFHSIAPRSDVVPNKRDLRWLKHIERHGPLSSTHLFEWTQDTHRCKDTSLRRLQALRAAGLLFLPKQQRMCERAEFKPYVYDLAPKGLLFLRGARLAENTVRPTGHWWHMHDVAMFTARIDLEARRRGYRYIPAHEILKRAGTTPAIPMGRRKLIPDQLFAIDYGGLFRAFMVEVDRGTEPIASASSRKSWRSALDLYAGALTHNVAQQHYQLRAPIAVLWQLHSANRQHAFEKLLAGYSSDLAARVVASKSGESLSQLTAQDRLCETLFAA